MRNAPEVAASAPQPEAQPMSQLDIMMRFTQAVERIEALFTGQTARVPPIATQPVPPPQPEVAVAPRHATAPVP